MRSRVQTVNVDRAPEKRPARERVLKHILLAATALALAAGPSDAADPQPFTPAPAAIPTTGATLRLGKCINISNMLEAPREGDWGRAFQTADIANIAGKGFTAIRLPARFSGHARREAPYTIDAGFMKRVRKITDLATARGMSVIVDMHHYEEIFKDPIGEAPRRSRTRPTTSISS